MNFSNKILHSLTILGITFLLSDIGMSLIITGGSDPIQDLGWAAGTVEVANLPTRFGWWEGPPYGGGEYHFLYRCEKTEQFNEALEKFAAIKSDRLELFIHNGPGKDYVIGGRIDWSHLSWIPNNWDSLKNKSRYFYRPADSNQTTPVPHVKKSVPAPRIDVYLGGENPIEWKNVKIPENIVIIDLRPGSVDKQFSGKGLVRGKVFDIETKQPINGARVTLFERILKPQIDINNNPTTSSGIEPSGKVYQGKTSSDGSCQINRIPLGTYEITVAANGYVSVDLELYDNTRAECYDFEASLAKPYTIKGIVTDRTGKPIKDVGVTARDFVGPDGNKYRHKADSLVLTDEQGRYEIPALPKGFARIRCRAEGLYQDDSIFEMYPIPCREIKLTMSGTAIVRGKVVDRDGKRPSGEIHLSIDPSGNPIGKWGYSGRLSQDGTFNISGIPPGEYINSTRPNPSRSKYKSNTKTITVEAGKTYELEILHAEKIFRR
jgi:hypothetical protein